MYKLATIKKESRFSSKQSYYYWSRLCQLSLDALIFDLLAQVSEQSLFILKLAKDSLIDTHNFLIKNDRVRICAHLDTQFEEWRKATIKKFIPESADI